MTDPSPDTPRQPPIPAGWDDLPGGGTAAPYTIATLVDIRDGEGNILLLHRKKHPNKDLYSPIGGKLTTSVGESPARCAQREIEEEAGVAVPFDRLHLSGVISEEGYNDQHWLMFWYRVTEPVAIEAHEMREGRLEWHPLDSILDLPLPDTDREVIWPLALEYSLGFFAVHIDCRGGAITHRVDQRIRPGAVPPQGPTMGIT